MNMIAPSRRNLITGLAASFLTAPAIVRAGSLMPISGETYRIWQMSSPLLPPLECTPEIFDTWLGPNGQLYRGTWTFFGKTHNIYSDEQIAFTKEEYPSPRSSGVSG